MMNFKRGTVFKTIVGLLTAGALLAPSSSYAADVDADGIGDESDGVPCDARASSVTFAPAKDQQGSLVFEDLWPAKGDLDFNDVALSYNYVFFLDDAGRVSSMQASVNLLAAGGSIANSVRLHLPVLADAAATIKLNGSDGVIHALTPEANEHELVVSLIPDVHAAMGDIQANSTTGKASVPGVPLNLYIKFKNPVVLDLTQAPFDLYIERVQEPGHQIHQVGYAGTDTMDTSLFGSADDGSNAGRHFVDVDGLPFALSVPAAFQWPREETSISTAYPNITAWATSGGAAHADWYQTNVDAASVWNGGADGSPPPIGVVLGPTNPSEDIQCARWKGTVQFGERPGLYPWATATDRSGNVIVAGEEARESDQLAFVTKYDSHKKAAWTKTLAGTSPYTSYKNTSVFGVAVDSESNIYVAGNVLGTIAGEDYDQANTSKYLVDAFVAKLDPNGNVVWVTHPQLSGLQLTASAITVGPNDTIATVGSTSANSLFIAQLDTSGQVLSLKESRSKNYEYAGGIAADTSGNLYINGYSSPVDANGGTLVAKFSPSADLLWSHVDDSNGYSASLHQQVAVDAQGSVYVSGFREAAPACSSTCYGTYEAPMWKFDTNGQQLWVTAMDTNSQAYATAIDANGNPYYAGVVWATPLEQLLHGSYNDFVTKVNPNTGAIVWHRESGTDVMEALSMATDPSGSVFLSGLTNTDVDGHALNRLQAYISKYDSNGNKQ